jgi:hypothetical protein
LRVSEHHGQFGQPIRLLVVEPEYPSLEVLSTDYYELVATKQQEQQTIAAGRIGEVNPDRSHFMHAN